jgi:hypothetical protein
MDGISGCFGLDIGDIKTNWQLDLDLVDIELGRKYWTSKYLSFRPFVGLRLGYIKQDFGMEFKGGSWAFLSGVGINAIGRADLDNNFKGVGIRSGFNTNWHLGCGWALYGDLAASILYGRFDVDHDESYRLVESPFPKTKVMETKDSFRASRAILDMDLGIQWSTMFCDCQYGFTVALGWEQHLFFHQNQMWRVTDNIAQRENDFSQKRGTLSTQGVTLTVQFEF